MINVNNFSAINNEVIEAIDEAFKAVIDSSPRENEVLLFLANAHLNKSFIGSSINPYVIDYRVDSLNDMDRLENLQEYLQDRYSFKDSNSTDTRFSLSIELMIYTHLWESKTFLKSLKNLAILSGGNKHDWNIEVPNMGKHKFIREEIRDVFKGNGLKIHHVISKGFHSQLRNAFAHSEYSIALNEPQFNLLNYTNSPWGMEYISFDDWTEKFCYSLLLNWRLLEKISALRQLLQEGEPGYRVFLKDKLGEDVPGILLYHEGQDGFTGRLL